MDTRRLLACLVTLGLVSGGCGDAEEIASLNPGLETIVLPSPDLEGRMSLEETLSTRRSVREFGDAALTVEEIAQLFWAAQGETRPGRRTNPSAGALYPMEVYVATEEGLYHYVSEGHRAELLATVDFRSRLHLAAYLQDAVGDAPAVFVICAVYARTEGKYGGRAERYVQLEAGHVAQSMLLQAVAMGLGGVPIGGFQDRLVQTTLGLPADHRPLYLIPIGHPS